MIFFYWLFLSGVVFLTGAYVSRTFITMPSGAEVCLIKERRKSLGESAASTILFFSVFTLIAGIIHYFLHASIMTETPLNEIFSVIFLFTIKTRYGNYTLIRTVLIICIVLVSFCMVLRSNKWSMRAGIIISLCLLGTLSISGHQGAKGFFSIPFFLDVAHIIAVSLWIGGLFHIRLCYSYFLKMEGFELWETFLSLINRFSNLATYCVFIGGAAGIWLLIFNVDSFSRFISTTYGKVLLIKILLVCIIFLLGGVNKFFILHSLNINEDRKELIKSKKRLDFLITAEGLIGFSILLSTSILTHLSPVSSTGH